MNSHGFATNPAVVCCLWIWVNPICLQLLFHPGLQPEGISSYNVVLGTTVSIRYPLLYSADLCSVVLDYFSSAWRSWKVDWLKLSRVLVEFWRFMHDEKWMTWGVRKSWNMESMSSRQILQISNTLQLIPWYQNNHTVHVSSLQTSSMRSMNQSTQNWR